MARLPALFLLVSTAAALELRLDARSTLRSKINRADSKIEQYIRDSGYRDDRRGQENTSHDQRGASNLGLFCCDVTTGYDGFFSDGEPVVVDKMLKSNNNKHETQNIFTKHQHFKRSNSLDTIFPYHIFVSRREIGSYRSKRTSYEVLHTDNISNVFSLAAFDSSLSNKENAHKRNAQKEKAKYQRRTKKLIVEAESLLNQKLLSDDLDNRLHENLDQILEKDSQDITEDTLNKPVASSGPLPPSLTTDLGSLTTNLKGSLQVSNKINSKVIRIERNIANPTQTTPNARRIPSTVPPASVNLVSTHPTLLSRTISHPPSVTLSSTHQPTRSLASAPKPFSGLKDGPVSSRNQGGERTTSHQPTENLSNAHPPPRSLASASKPVPGLEDGPVSRRNQGRERTIQRTPSLKSLQAARELLQKEPLVDGHNDLAWNVRVLLHNRLQKFNLSSDLRRLPAFRDSGFSHTDLPRLRAGLVGAQVWSVHIPCGAQFRNAVQLLVEQIDVVRRMLHDCDQTTLVTSPDGLLTAWSQGLLASMISVGGGHGLGSSVGVLRSLHDLGVTSLSLTHSCHTPWAEGDEDAEGQFTERGLTSFGKAIVRELNRLGMMVDIAHASPATARDAIATSRAPVIISHTAAREICNLSRNVPDSILHALRTSGGLAMVTFDSDFLACGRNATIRTVIDHLEHIRRVAGVDHVGLGSAFDGFDRPAHGLQDSSQYPSLFAALMEARPVWSKEDLLKLSGRNFVRVFQRVKEVQASLSEEPPSEDIIPFKDIDTRWPCRYKFTKADHPYT